MKTKIRLLFVWLFAAIGFIPESKGQSLIVEPVDMENEDLMICLGISRERSHELQKKMHGYLNEENSTISTVMHGISKHVKTPGELCVMGFIIYKKIKTPPVPSFLSGLKEGIPAELAELFGGLGG